MGRSDVVALMIDAAEELTDQDHKLADGKIEEAGKAAVLVVNKWDLIENKSSRLMNEFNRQIASRFKSTFLCRNHLHQCSYAPTRHQNHRRLPLELSNKQEGVFRPGLLNQIINEAVALVHHHRRQKRGKRLRIYYSTQASVAPPTFVLFANDRSLMDPEL